MNSIKLDFLNKEKIKKYNKKYFKNLSPIEIINELVKNGKKIEDGKESKLLIEIMDNIIYDYEDDYIDKPDVIDKINKNKYRKERKYNIINLLEKYKRLQLYTLNFTNNKKKIKLLIIIDNKTGVFSIYVGDINSKRYCGYITFTTSPYKVNNNITKDNFVNIKYNYGYIEWIKPKENCNLSLTGTEILQSFINLGYLFNIDRIDLQDAANIFCVYNNKIYENSLKYYKLILEGSTWYEKYNFLPCPEKKIRKDLEKQLLFPHLPPLSYNDINLHNKLIYKNFYKEYQNYIKIFNSFNIYYVAEINKIINNDIILKKKLLNDYNIENDFLQILDIISKNINKINKNNKLYLKEYIKKINEINCIHFNNFQEIFINDDIFIDTLYYIINEYEEWFNIKIINEINSFYNSLKFLEKINYYFLIL